MAGSNNRQDHTRLGMGAWLDNRTHSLVIDAVTIDGSFKNPLDDRGVTLSLQWLQLLATKLNNGVSVESFCENETRLFRVALPTEMTAAEAKALATALRSRPNPRSVVRPVSQPIMQ